MSRHIMTFFSTRRPNPAKNTLQSCFEKYNLSNLLSFKGLTAIIFSELTSWRQLEKRNISFDKK